VVEQVVGSELMEWQEWQGKFLTSERWLILSGVLCDPRVPLQLKGKFYRIVVQPVMFAAEC
jgi:hypothetical protein